MSLVVGTESSGTESWTIKLYVVGRTQIFVLGSGEGQGAATLHISAVVGKSAPGSLPSRCPVQSFLIPTSLDLPQVALPRSLDPAFGSPRPCALPLRAFDLSCLPVASFRVDASSSRMRHVYVAYHPARVVSQSRRSVVWRCVTLHASVPASSSARALRHVGLCVTHRPCCVVWVRRCVAL